MSYAPILTPSQIERIRAFALPRPVSAGEILYEPGDDTPPVFVVISGAITIIARGGAKEQTVTSYGVGQFSGELLMLSGRKSIYRCEAVEDGILLELSAKDLRALIAKDAELSDIFMKAFLARRVSLKSLGQGNVLILGSRYSAATLAAREFLARDGHPFTYLDLDADEAAQELLDRFGVSQANIPVVICNGTQVLRNPSPKQIAECLGFNSNIDESHVRDLVIVGAGPAGLAAAVYAASEGLDVLVIEKAAPGGQAGSSSKIENYLGFPTGLSGHELAASAIALEDYLASYAGDRFWHAMAFVRDYPNSLPRLTKRLAEVTVPCQITVGRHDPFVPVSNAEGLKKRLTKSKLNVLDCGHFAWEDAAQEYGKLACEFIQGGYEKL